MPHTKRIAELLLNIEAVKLSVDPPFTWTSGIKSPIYCDNRMLYSFPEARKFVVEALASRVESLHIPPDVIAGTATAAIGWAALVADELDLPFIYVRSKPKEHGTQKRIEGFLKPDQHVVLIEDLISTAGSSISSVEALRTEGKAVVTDIVAIFSYELPAALEKAGEANVQLHPLSTFTALINLACDNGEITPDQFALMKRFAKDPEAWGRAL
jgi:orotate phosphoribosyltransferase